jgi:hypothetical protein
MVHNDEHYLKLHWQRAIKNEWNRPTDNDSKQRKVKEIVFKKSVSEHWEMKKIFLRRFSFQEAKKSDENSSEVTMVPDR